MKIHNRIIGSFVLVDNWVGVQTYNQIIALSSGFFQEIQMTDVEQIESSSHVNDFITWLKKINESFFTHFSKCLSKVKKNNEKSFDNLLWVLCPH